jgi:hypothetical protein
MAADIYKKLTIYLADESPKVFQALREDFIEKRSLPFAVELLTGLLEKNLPHYTATELPGWESVYRNRDRYYQKALEFLKENEKIFYPILLDKNFDIALKTDLLYVLAKYLPDSGCESDAFLRLSAVALYLASIHPDTSLGRLADQALCRYGMNMLANAAGLHLSCDGKPPYSSIDKVCKQEEYKSPFCQIFSFSFDDSLLNATKEALSDLPESIRTFMLEALNKLLDAQKKLQPNDSPGNISKLEYITINNLS